MNNTVNNQDLDDKYLLLFLLLSSEIELQFSRKCAS